jgi:hypothetical protein
MRPFLFSVTLTVTALAFGKAPLGREVLLAVPKFAGVRRQALVVWVTCRGTLAPLQSPAGWLAP